MLQPGRITIAPAIQPLNRSYRIRSQTAFNTRIDTRVAINLRSRQPLPVIMARRDQPFRRAPVNGTVQRTHVVPGET